LATSFGIFTIAPDLKRTLVWLRGLDLTASPAKLHFTFASSILSFAKPSAEAPCRPMTYFMGLLEWIET